MRARVDWTKHIPLLPPHRVASCAASRAAAPTVGPSARAAGGVVNARTHSRHRDGSGGKHHTRAASETSRAVASTQKLETKPKRHSRGYETKKFIQKLFSIHKPPVSTRFVNRGELYTPETRLSKRGFSSDFSGSNHPTTPRDTPRVTDIRHTSHRSTTHHWVHHQAALDSSIVSPSSHRQCPTSRNVNHVCVPGTL